MVATITGDDLFLFRQTTQVVVVPHQLRLCFVGVGSRQAVEDLAHFTWSHLHQTIRQACQLVSGVRRIAMIVSELVGLT
ncbi:hypothetical protein D3C80_1907330 [compost metagenome]